MPILANSGRYYHAQVPERLMRKLLANIPTSGWLPAFYDLLGNLPPTQADAVCRDVLKRERALGLSLLPPTAGARALDLGSGWGTLSLPLAQAGWAVTSMDLAPLRARVTQLRANEDGLRNVLVVVGGDTPHLPFAESHFDAVVLNGVLEWVAVNEQGTPRDAQLKYLREVRRIIKPAGFVYIGVENRLSHHYLRGSPEDHVGLRWMALLPRRLADLWTKSQIGAPYRTHTYTLYGYRHLLRDAGYDEVRFFYPHSSYRHPSLIIPLDGHVGLRVLFQLVTGGRVRRAFFSIAAWMGLLKWLGHSYIILAQKPEA
jgi:SAM-dependent methyltransferase